MPRVSVDDSVDLHHRIAGSEPAQDLPGWSVGTPEHSGHGSMVDEPARVAELLSGFSGGQP